MLELFNYSFFQQAFLVGILSAIACGIIGSFVVVKKISFISGSIAHSSLGGLGLAYYLGINPIMGAFVFSILSALSIGLINKKNKHQEDAIIGAIWAIGMAIGLFFVYLTPGYASDLFSYLFGNILLVSRFDLGIILIIDLVIVFSVLAFYNFLVAFIFDEEFAKVTGINTFTLYLFLLILISISIIALMKAVGLILVIALLTLPASTAQLLTKNFKHMIFLSITLALLFNITGLFLSYYINMPSGPIIIFIAAITYFIVWLKGNIRLKLGK